MRNPDRHRHGDLWSAACLLLLLVLTGCRVAHDQAGPTPEQATGADTTSSYLSSVDEAAAAVIMVAWRGSEPPVPGVTRSREQARQLAEQLGVLVREQLTFAEAARRYSDDPATRERGGYAGIVHKGTWPLPLEVALFQMPVGGIRAGIETPRGFFVLQRLPIRRVRAHHILIAWRGAEQAAASVTRSEEQARLMAEQVRQLCLVPGADLCQLTARYSDDTANRFACGLIGTIQPYALDEQIARALFRLRPGEISPPIRTRFGYHLLWRDPDDPAGQTR